MIYAPLGASCLAALRPNHDPRPALDEDMALGFRAVRTFGGPLPWANQTLADVYRNLPPFLGWARERGLNVYLPYITEAGLGYDLDAHVRELERITADRDNVLKSTSNESTHPTQGGRLPPERCAQLAAMMAGPVSYGAGPDDESLEYAGGAFVSSHLDRSRPAWNWVRRVREQMAVSESAGKPVMSGEPMGAGEQHIPGKREADAALFYGLGSLNRLFLCGSGVFHSEDGLWARPLGPVQRQCAEAFVRGATIWPGAARLRYYNVGHSGSPIVSATFNDGDMSKPGCTRSYCGLLTDTLGLNCTIGISDMANPGAEIGNGWRWGAEIGREQGVIVREVLR